MTKTRRVMATILVGVTAAASVALAAETGRITAQFTNAQKQPIGEAVLQQTPHGVLLTADVSNLTPGAHGFHIHQTGKCEPPFTSAGEHLNPSGKSHGFEAPKGPHVGDLPNLDVSQDGRAKVELFLPGATLEPGKSGSLLDADGAALVLHAGADDYASDPAGKSGDRVACAAIESPRKGAGGGPQARLPSER